MGNKHRYSMHRAANLLLGLVCSACGIFFRKKDHIVFSSAFNTQFCDNSRTLFEYLYTQPGYKDKVYFVINDERLRQDLLKEYPGRILSNRRIKDLVTILSARYWVASWLEFPAPGYFNRHFRMVYHLGHGMPYKRAGLMERRISWYKRLYYALVTSNVSYSIATTAFFKKTIADIYGLKLKQILLLPQPKTGAIVKPAVVADNLLADSEKMHVLYAPTWRPAAEVKLFPFPDFNVAELADFLSCHGIHIWVRMHPRFDEKMVGKVMAVPNVHAMTSANYPEVNSYLAYFDCLVTDYSSIYFDYLSLRRPVLFFDYDFDDYQAEIGVIDDYQKVKCAESTVSMRHFFRQLAEIKAGEMDLSRISEIDRLVNYPIDTDQINTCVSGRLFAYKA